MLTGTPEASSVAALQANLSAVLPELLLIVDGIFGRETQQAVRVFQAREGLPVTGIADLVTWELLNDRAESARVSQLEAEPLRLALLPGQILRAGEKNRHLFLVQGMLAALCDAYEDIPSAPSTGVLDQPTAESIRAMQARYGLPVTGEVDKATWQLLARDYRSAVGDGTATQ